MLSYAPWFTVYIPRFLVICLCHVFQHLHTIEAKGEVFLLVKHKNYYVFRSNVMCTQGIPSQCKQLSKRPYCISLVKEQSGSNKNSYLQIEESVNPLFELNMKCSFINLVWQYYRFHWIVNSINRDRKGNTILLTLLFNSYF